METDPQETQSTYKSRMLRLHILTDEIKTKKTMNQDDLLRFGMNRWMMSRIIVQRYIDELYDKNIIKKIYNPLTDITTIEFIAKEAV
jgi:ATP-dependent protease Clp ATPase subunit